MEKSLFLHGGSGWQWGASVLGLLCVPLLVFASQAKRPNILLVMADDLGFSDFGCNGGEIPTPNIDVLARTGLRFAEFYNNGVCGPTRASLLTGLYAQRIGHSGGGWNDPTNYRVCVTVGEALLQRAGYHTTMAGKWQGAELPADFGFDRSFAMVGTGAGNYRVLNQDAKVPGWRLDGVSMRLGSGPKVMPGPSDTFDAYGQAWATVSNTPFRDFKRTSFEGGVRTPLIAHWPAVTEGSGQVVHGVGHVMDFMPTFPELAGVSYPREYKERKLLPLDGESFAAVLRGARWAGRTELCWNLPPTRGIRSGTWKLVERTGSRRRCSFFISSTMGRKRGTRPWSSASVPVNLPRGGNSGRRA